MGEHNRCPKCNNILFVDKEEDDWWEWCINCSYRKAMGVIVESNLLMALSDKKNPNRSEKEIDIIEVI